MTVDIFSGVGSLLYSMILPIVWQGQTVGKYVMGIQIVKTDGRKLGIGAMLMRVLVANILYGITLYILMITSIIMVLVRKDKRAVHDFLAGTRVVKKSW
ncbi:RDD family protein [Marinococcus luteus]|uniref:RDD family protein n=1 Tax=Marinococcus luteus TaxID=1122204 RepID=UPI002ACD003D|nr:RDD family protein [Marinococcus luteus]MDZ5782022.1 RDD family protein [Marinococcus luteus]